MPSNRPAFHRSFSSQLALPSYCPFNSAHYEPPQLTWGGWWWGLQFSLCGRRPSLWLFHLHDPGMHLGLVCGTQTVFCVCVHVCVCMHACVFVYACVYAHTYMYTCLHTHICECACVCMHMCVFVYIVCVCVVNRLKHVLRLPNCSGKLN